MSLLGWPIGLFASIFMYDAPTASVIPKLLALALLVYPGTVIPGTIMYWKNRSLVPIKQLRKFTLISAIGPSAVLLLVLVLDVVCQGKFVCD
jgi:hypothetical protein